MPRLYLISPSHHLGDGRLVKTTRYWTSGLTMPALKALAPRERSLEHADAVVVGEAEQVWARVLGDLAAGRSEGV